ncbi:MAG: SDR family NAD(P)-dependent oxidoreductase [Methyloceanibacter sp.]|uniref:SDR family NAD(P)-dependent oxidoreductase n=1 Tax=Methyloceanibacter sp. TaxID=1965321 RepID=UPI003D6D7449
MNESDERQGPLAPAAVITGATQGIGRALADEFAKGGHTLLLVARDEAKLAKTGREVSAAHHVKVHHVACDLSTAESCDRVEDALRRNGLYCESLVNNAAIMRAGFFQDQDRETLLKLVDLNVRAAVDLTRRFLPDMLARGRGGVLNVASLEGFMPVPYQATYAATKGLMIAWSRALAWEVYGSGVRICVVTPGPIATDLHAKAGAEHSRYVVYLPLMTPEQMAEAAYRRFMRGNWVIIEGWLNRLIAFVVRFVPGIMLIPAIGWFFRVRDADGNLQQPKPLKKPEDASRRPTSKA